MFHQPVNSPIADGFEKSSRSRLAGRVSELEGANRKVIFIHTANV